MKVLEELGRCWRWALRLLTTRPLLSLFVITTGAHLLLMGLLSLFPILKEEVSAPKVSQPEISIPAPLLIPEASAAGEGEPLELSSSDPAMWGSAAESLPSEDILGAFRSLTEPKEKFELPQPQAPWRAALPENRKFHFFDMEVEGNNVVYLVDLSGSMYRRAGPKTRLRIVFDEIGRSLNRLTEHHRFNIVLFAGQATAFRADSIPATTGNKVKALKYLNRSFDLTGSTDLEAGMRAALAMKPDVILLVTDGEMNESIDYVRSKVAALTSTTARKIQIHTIGFFLQRGSREEQFLRELAIRNQGRYVRWNEARSLSSGGRPTSF